MTIYIHELKRNFKPLMIWSVSVSFMLAVCLLLYPEMETQMDAASDMFASMGAFTAAFGMDRINFGSLLGYYTVECGSVLGIGGAFYAAYIGVSMLSKEESGHTSEFLLMHPRKRSGIVLSKLAAAVTCVIVLNAMSCAVSLASFAAIGQTPPWKVFWIFIVAQLLTQLETAAVCFGISAFVRRGAIGIGLGSAAMLYFLNLFANISDKARFAKYITPFAYSDAADIITDSSLDAALVILGAVYSVAAVLTALIYYSKKDMAS